MRLQVGFLAAALSFFSIGAAAQDINALFAQLIRLRGFQCPMVEKAILMGNDHYGKVAKLWCGQADNRGNPIYFRVTEIPGALRPDYRIEPWHD